MAKAKAARAAVTVPERKYQAGGRGWSREATPVPSEERAAWEGERAAELEGLRESPVYQAIVDELRTQGASGRWGLEPEECVAIAIVKGLAAK